VNEPKKLPVAKVLLGAFVFPWWRRRAFATSLAVPGAIIVAGHVLLFLFGEALPYAAQLATGIAVWAVWVVYAVIVHRLVLLGSPGDMAVVPRWTRRETVFFAWLVLAAAITTILTMFTEAALTAVLPKVPAAAAASGWISLAVATYAWARLAPLFPATAVDAGTGLAAAWNLTRGNGWRMAVAVGALPWAATLVVGFLDRAELTIMHMVLSVVLGTIFMAVEIAALSLAYRELSSTADS
jgi:hypothetical protein